MMRAASTTTRKPAGLWRYSLRWSLPHKPCPGPLEARHRLYRVR